MLATTLLSLRGMPSRHHQPTGGRREASSATMSGGSDGQPPTRASISCKTGCSSICAGMHVQLYQVEAHAAHARECCVVRVVVAKLDLPCIAC